ncbi:transcriptional regulator FilR1 domain-containing protein [Halorubellus litoreus]|uniref:Winged helix-turn-helix transcriptional regulator n=1 Tax=Halorubellus litoreus TaxID=755308 RepID=A0ABD5VLD4_9EURY
MEPGEVAERRETVARRAEFVELLEDEGVLNPADIVDELAHSRSTVTRALRELCDAGLVENRDGGYAATVTGVMAVEEFRRHEAASRAILRAKELLDPLVDPSEFDPAFLTGGETYLADESAPFRPLEEVVSRVREADSVQAYLPTLVNPSLLRVWHRKVRAEGMESVGLFDEELLTLLKGQYPQLLAEMGAADAFSAFTADGPRHALLLTTKGGAATASVVVYDGDSGVKGAIVNDSDSAVEWARDRFERLKDSASAVTAEFDALAGAVELGPSDLEPADSSDSRTGNLERDGGFAGHALPLDLEREGFTRLSKEYFESREQARPEVSWRTGFTLSEVRGGHAVDRFDDEDRNFVDRMLSALQAGPDHVVLGPPGAGKSTACMSVACEWYDQQIGPVVYRERGAGGEFSSPSLLEAYLRQTDDHALVVVEDAIRTEANGIFDVMLSLKGRDDVTFLLDSRTSEWNASDDLVGDPRVDAYRRRSVEQVPVPELDADGCERFVDHFRSLIAEDIDASGTELQSAVADGALSAPADTRPPGRALLAQTHLSRRVDTVADPDGTVPNALDADVRETCQSLLDADPEYATELAVLASLCNAAGIPVATEYLYGIAEPDRCGDIEAAISVLEGRVLFEHRGVTAPRMEYRTHHETWSRRFLERFLELLSEDRARAIFGRCTSRLLSLADDADRRNRIERQLNRTAPHLHRIESDPGGWGDELVERIFRLGHTNAGLAPLYGETDDGTIAVPDACSEFIRQKQHYWRGEMNRLQGNLRRGKAEIEQLLDADSSPDGLTEREAKRLRYRGHGGIWHFSAINGDYETAIDHARRSLALAEELEDVKKMAQARAIITHVEIERNNLEEAQAQYERFRELADEHQSPTYAGTALEGARCSFLQGAHQQAKERLREYLDRIEDADSTPEEASARYHLGRIAIVEDDFETAKSHLSRAMATSRSSGASMVESQVHASLGRVAHLEGRLEDAESHLERASEHGRGVPSLVAPIHAVLADVAFDRGNLDRSESLARKGLEAAADDSAPIEMADVSRTLARIALREDSYEDAEAHLVRCREASRTLDNPLLAAKCNRLRARLELARGKEDEAEEYARQALDRCREYDTTSDAAGCLRLLGLTALERDHIESSADYLLAGLEAAKESGVVTRTAELHTALARLELTRQDPQSARNHLESALDIAARLGDEERVQSIRNDIAALDTNPAADSP